MAENGQRGKSKKNGNRMEKGNGIAKPRDVNRRKQKEGKRYGGRKRGTGWL
jgi:hypothetical protein